MCGPIRAKFVSLQVYILFKINVPTQTELILKVESISMHHHICHRCYHCYPLPFWNEIPPVRIGYLTCNLFLHKDHELMLLLINTMQRDLQSANHIEVCDPVLRNHSVFTF